MKHAILSMILSLGTMSYALADVAVPEQTEIVKKEVCIKVWDAKQQKEVKKCRKIKKHKPHEGTAVPGGASK